MIPVGEYTLSYVRSPGPGGQNVNKVSSAIHLRFDVRASSLPEAWKQRVLALADRRITADGIVVIKAQQHRSREQNEADALRRLAELLRRGGILRKRRVPTRPTASAKQRRVDEKKRRSRMKRLRTGPRDDHE